MGVDEYIYVNIAKSGMHIAYPLNRGAGISTSLGEQTECSYPQG